MQVEKTSLPGVVVVTPSVQEDEHGFSMETFHQTAFVDAGLPGQFVQETHARLPYGVLKGLHFQYPHWQGRLVRVIHGEVFSAVVDVRMDSPTYAQWCAVVLREESRQQIYIPPGYAHGFCVISERADVEWKCTALDRPRDEIVVRWDDPAIGIDWPLQDPALSAGDRAAGPLSDVHVR